MIMAEMKKLVIGDNEYEVVDEKAREELSTMGDENINNESLWEYGSINAITGVNSSSSTWLRMKDYIPESVVSAKLHPITYCRFMAWDENGEYVGLWNGTEFAKASYGASARGTLNLKTFRENYPTYNFKLSVGGLTLEDVKQFVFSNEIFKNAFDRTKNLVPTLTFVDDDGHTPSVQAWEDIGDTIGIRCTFALVTGSVGNENRITWDEVGRLSSKGFEFISHTHNHVNIPQTDESAVMEDLALSVAALREHNCESRFLIYPNNNTPAVDLRNRTVKHFFSGAAAGGEVANNSPMNPLTLKRFSILTDDYVAGTSQYEYKSLDTLKSIIDDCVANSSWVIIMTHLRNDSMYYYNAEVKQMIVDLCKYAVNKGVEITTFGKAFDKRQNRFAEWTVAASGNETYSYVVDADGVVFGT